MADPRTFGAQASLDRLIVHLAAAINARALYAMAHPALLRAVQRLTEAVVVVCDDRRQDSVTLLLVGDEIVVDQRPLHSGGLYHQPIINALRRCHVERLTLGRGLEPAEGQALVDALVQRRVPAPTPNVIVGQLEIVRPEGAGGAEPSTADPGGTGGRGRSRAGDPEGGKDSDAAGRAWSGDQIDTAMATFCRFRTERRAALRQFEELVWGFVDTLFGSMQEMLPLAPLRGHDEYTFVHSVNVSLLVLALARSFGLQGEMLHAMGLAALLHDVGKLKIPLAVLNKPGRLEDDEWRVMMTHTDLGTWQLSGLETTPLAILVAYEHHLRFDGQASYPVLKTPRRPTLASQLTALADVYDAICTTRPYRKALSQKTALDVLRSRAGTFHDPFLVGHFCQLLNTGTDAPEPSPTTP